MVSLCTRLSKNTDKHSYSKLIIATLFHVSKTYKILKQENSIFLIIARRSFLQVIHNAFLVAFYVLLVAIKNFYLYRFHNRIDKKSFYRSHNNMRWKCTCAYDGTRFSGWQSQANHQAVQDVLEERLCAIFKKFIRIHGSSRTDAGVHARGQVFHFDADWPWGPERLKLAINAQLEHDIRILAVEEVSDRFHARFSVKKKTYCYHLLLKPADPFQYPYVWDISPRNFKIDYLQETLPLFVGTHDFRGFAGKTTHNENTLKTIYRAELHPTEEGIDLTFTGSGFLYRMVRILVGSLVLRAYGKIDTAFIQQRLQLKNLSLPVVTAPARGLFLESIVYDS